MLSGLAFCQLSGFPLNIGHGGMVIWNKDLLFYRFYLFITNKYYTRDARMKPAPKIYTVCENCWIKYPHTKPTTANNVTMNLDHFSDLHCPLKSCSNEKDLYLIEL